VQGPTITTIAIDANGRVGARRDVLLRADGYAERGIASGPNGAVGLAIESTTPGHWSVYPVDGSAPVDLALAVEGAPLCTAAQPWTLVITRGREDLVIDGYGTRTIEIYGVGEGGTCIAGMVGRAPQEARVVAALAVSGHLRGTIASDAERGVAATCATTVAAGEGDE
jgi:hypothetical protein